MIWILNTHKGIVTPVISQPTKLNMNTHIVTLILSFGHQAPRTLRHIRVIWPPDPVSIYGNPQSSEQSQQPSDLLNLPGQLSHRPVGSQSLVMKKRHSSHVMAPAELDLARSIELEHYIKTLLTQLMFVISDVFSQSWKNEMDNQRWLYPF